MLMTVLSVGQVWASELSIDFESAASAYADWTFTTLVSKQSNTQVGTHGGSYYGGTDGKTSGSIVTKSKIASPSSITFYVSKETTNTTASYWLVKVSTDGSSWTQVGDAQSAASGITKGTWTEVTRDLSSYSNVYVGVFYQGTSAKRCLDDLVLMTTGGDTPTKCETPTFSVDAGTFYESSIEVELACTTSGAAIHYTLDGSTPTSGSATYSSAIEVTATTTIKAIAVKDGLTNSDVASATYTKGTPVTSYNIDFETNNLAAYVNWDFSNIAIVSTAISAHGGTYYGNTDGKGSASITTKAKYTNPGVLTFYTSKESGNTTSSSWLVQVSSDGSDWSDVETFDATAGSKGAWAERTADLSAHTNVYVRIAYSGSTAIRAIDDISLAAASANPKAAKPTFETGDDFVTSTSVTLACATEGAKIYYTTNGDVPTSGSTLYEGAIPVNTTTTIKAIAIADGYDASPVAEKTFTKVEALESLAALLEATTSTETAFNVVIENWVVTGVNGTRAWIADVANEKGILLYKSGHGFEAGNKLNGVVLGTKTKLYQGYPELTTLVSTDVTVSDADPITPRTTTIAALTSGYNKEQGTVVKLENVTYTSSALFDGVNSIAADNKLFSSLALVDGTEYDITGVVEYDGSNVKIMPRSADDVYAHSAVVIPTAANLAALKAKENKGTYILTLDHAVVSYVNGNNAFIEDATAGALIYISNHGFSAGDCLTGDYQVTTADHQGKFEITAIEAQAGAETTTAAIPLTTLTIAQLNENFASYESRRVKIVGAEVTDAISGSDRNGAISDGAAVAVYAAAGASKITLTANDNVDIIGYPGFYNTDQQLNVWAQADIKVNEKDPAGIAFDPEYATHTPGIDEWSAPTFANPNNLDVDFGTNNDAVATVSNTGVVSLAGGYGTAVITAHTNGDVTHSAGNATYTITVNDPSLAPQNVVILAVYSEKYYAMSTTNANNGFTAIAVEYDGTQVTVKSAAEKAAIQWAKQTSGDNTTFQNAAGKFMKSADGASMSLQDAVCNWVWDATGEYYKIDGTSRTFFFQNTSGGIFKNYATSNLNGNGYSGKAQVIAIAPANIVITSKVSAELAYDPASDEITKGDDWSAPTLVNPHSVTITSYASDNEAVATVSDGGVIALAGGIGTAVITAHFDGDASYLEGDAVYTIKVNAVPEPTEDCDGADDFITATNTSASSYNVERTTTNGWHSVNSALTTIEEEARWLTMLGKTSQVGVITSPTLNDGIASLKVRYANTFNESNGVSVKVDIKQGEDIVKTYTITKANSEVVKGTVYTELIENINVAGDFQIVITNLCPSDADSNKDRVSIGKLCWSNYSATEPQYTEIRTGLEPGRHYTVCLEKNVTAVKGATFWSLTYKNNENTAAYLVEETEIAAGKPYIFQATGDNNGKLEVLYGTETATNPVENGALRGTFSYLNAEALNTINATDDNEVYMLFNNELRPIGTNNHLDDHRAYVLYNLLQPVSSTSNLAPGKKVKAMPLHKETATDIDNLNASEKPVKMVIDGQLYIIRGEKMYDATGRLVK